MIPVVVNHPAVHAIDLPKLVDTCQTPEEVEELLYQIEAAIREVAAGKGVPQDEMEPPFEGWYRKKFHSRRRVPVGARADMRLLCQLSPDRSRLRILAVGKRNVGGPDDIYALVSARDQSLLAP